MPENKSIYNELWHTGCCGQGKECWCREIRTTTGREVLSGACLSMREAHYLVQLHNRSTGLSKGRGKISTPKDSSVHDQLWRTVCCHVGKNCWCRRIHTKSGKKVLGTGWVGKELVMYMVKLHNQSVRGD